MALSATLSHKQVMVHREFYYNQLYTVKFSITTMMTKK